MSKTNPKDIAQALVEISKVLPDKDREAACDAALTLLEKSSNRDLNGFPGRVLQALEAHDGIIFAVAITPSGSLGDHEKTLHAALEKAFGRKVQLTQKADPSLIGGMVLQVGDERFDASVRGDIDSLTARLLQPLADAASHS